MNMTHAIESFLDLMSQNSASANTIRAYKADLNGLSEYLGNPMMYRESVETQAKTYLRTSQECWEPRTAKRKLSSFRSFGRYMGWEGFLSGYRVPRPAAPRPHPLPGGIPDVMAMVEVAPTSEHVALVALTGLLGMRVSSAIRCKTTDFDLTEMIVMVWAKGNKYYEVPVNAKVWELLAPAFCDAIVRSKGEHPDTRLVRYRDRAARQWITDLGKRAAVRRPIASHDMRATAGTAAYKRSKDLRATQMFLGHSDSKTTEVYTLVDVDAMREATDFV